MSWEEVCARCGNTLFWWRSRSGIRICMVCNGDPLSALETLARYGGSQGSCKKCNPGV
jgi:hypothetical protein